MTDKAATIATALLMLRPPRLTDVPALFAFLGDPVAIRHTHVDPAVWGQGYATEFGRGCLDLADRVLKLPEVKAFAAPENMASRRVLENSGS